ncbi:hypothetical protein D9M68_956670 [compost metagenome]
MAAGQDLVRPGSMVGRFVQRLGIGQEQAQGGCESSGFLGQDVVAVAALQDAQQVAEGGHALVGGFEQVVRWRLDVHVENVAIGLGGK